MTKERATLGTEAAQFLAQVHAQGFYHDDCAADHILVAPSLGLSPRSRDRPSAERFALIDIDNGRLFEGPVSRGRRTTNLYQILRSLRFKDFPNAEREIFISRQVTSA